ncbi:MAG: ATP-binding protein [Deltaproteobacteria bacterium]|nr:MAG: ATP-binding protein [Deltaproteobacteria bacterium]
MSKRPHKSTLRTTIRTHRDNTIVVPDKVPLRRSAQRLQTFADAQESPVAFSHSFPGFFVPEVGYLLNQLLEERYGFNLQQGTSGPCPEPPRTIVVNLDYGESTTIPWGRMDLPDFGDDSYIEFHTDHNNIPCISGSIWAKYEDDLNNLIDELRLRLTQRSIYQGKAITVDFSWAYDDREEYDPNKHEPQFLQPTFADRSELIFSSRIRTLLDAHIFGPIEYSSEYANAGLLRKTGVLLAGPYGCGKTLTCSVVANLCIRNSWTFILVEDPSHLVKVLELARRLTPCVIFCEDIDTVIKGSTDADRTQLHNDILNSLDSVGNKSDHLMCIFTTNQPEAIHPAFLRPGRIDNLIPIEPPDAEAAAQLAVRIAEIDADPTDIGNVLAGHIPATIRAIVTRASAFTMRENGRPRPITLDELVAARDSYLEHARLCEPRRQEKVPDLVKAARIIADALRPITEEDTISV